MGFCEQRSRGRRKRQERDENTRCPESGKKTIQHLFLVGSEKILSLVSGNHPCGRWSDFRQDKEGMKAVGRRIFLGDDRSFDTLLELIEIS